MQIKRFTSAPTQAGTGWETLVFKIMRTHENSIKINDEIVMTKNIVI